MDTDALLQILETHKDKSFVDRILNRDRYPVLDVGEGYTASHRMSWGQVDNKYHVYPTIFYSEGKLTEYGSEEAWKRAHELDEFIEFDNPEDAEWFSKNYKQYWGIKSMQDQINKMNEAIK